MRRRLEWRFVISTRIFCVQQVVQRLYLGDNYPAVIQIAHNAFIQQLNPLASWSAHPKGHAKLRNLHLSIDREWNSKLHHCFGLDILKILKVIANIVVLQAEIYCKASISTSRREGVKCNMLSCTRTGRRALGKDFFVLFCLQGIFFPCAKVQFEFSVSIFFFLITNYIFVGCRYCDKPELRRRPFSNLKCCQLHSVPKTFIYFLMKYLHNVY